MKLQMYEHKMPGMLITFCGLDGSGKTTQIGLLNKYLNSLDKQTVLTKQPTDAVRNSEMFRCFQDLSNTDNYDYRSLSLMCASDRLQHCNRVIMPLLKQNKIVLSDRYYYSCIANLNARGYKNDSWIYEIAKYIPKPDISFFIDVPVKTAIRRVHMRPAEKDLCIDENFQKLLRDQYLKLAQDNNGIILDGTTPITDIFMKICKETDRLLNASQNVIQ